jgi:hypothetical protein
MRNKLAHCKARLYKITTEDFWFYSNVRKVVHRENDTEIA